MESNNKQPLDQQLWEPFQRGMRGKTWKCGYFCLCPGSMNAQQKPKLQQKPGWRVCSSCGVEETDLLAVFVGWGSQWQSTAWQTNTQQWPQFFSAVKVTRQTAQKKIMPNTMQSDPSHLPNFTETLLFLATNICTGHLYDRGGDTNSMACQ